MSLQMILGGSGSGKSTKLYQMVIERAMAFPNEKILLIVPEQYTMQTQKHIVEAHPKHGVLNVDILSFERLAYRIFDELGVNQKEILEDTGKSMIIRRLLSEHKEELYAFRRHIRKQGFVDQVKSMLSELLQYGITPEILEQKSAELGSDASLLVKLQDIGLIYRAFMQFIEARYITTEEVLDRLSDVIEQSEMIRHSMIFMDNFTGFTPIQYRLLTRMLNLSPSIVMTLTVDISDHPYLPAKLDNLFYLTRDTLSRLEMICREYHIKREEDILLADSSKGRYLGSRELGYLEKYLFREITAPYPEDNKDILFYQMPEPRSEMQFAAMKIHELVATGACRYEEIAVVTSDMERYRRGAQYWFEKYEIPCFFDGRRDVSGSMLIVWLRSLLNMFIRGFNYESVFAYLRCGLSGFSAEETDRLEDYVLALGIRGISRWQQVWTAKTDGMDENELVLLNRIRESFVEPLQQLCETANRKEAVVVEWLQAIYTYMLRLDIRHQVEKWQKEFEQSGDLARAKEYEQIYQVVIQLMEKIYLILGEEILSVRELSEVLEAGVSEIRLGIIPPGMDQVTFGDIRRTRLDHIRVLFFVGMNEGLVPLAESSAGLINEQEREQLARHHVVLAPTARENTCMEHFYLYASMTKPSDRLFISWSRQDASGREMRPSVVLGDIRKVFPGLKTEKFLPDDGYLSCQDVKQGYQYMIQGLRNLGENGKMEDQWLEVYQWFHHHPIYEKQTESLVEAAFYRYWEETLSKAAVRAVYGGQLTGGVTMLEKYAACAYAHFLSYGLRLKERQIYQVQAPDIGMIFHQSIERFSMRIGHSGYQWRDIPDDKRDRIVEECVQSVVMAYNHSVMKDSHRAEYLTEKILRMAKRTVWALQQQLKKGDFDPVGYELKFTTELQTDSMHIVCGEDGHLDLNGKIDRMDICEEDGKRYLRIIDYKSGHTAFDLSSVYYGLQMQLMVYMNAACEIEKKKQDVFAVIPSGVLYYHIDDPLIQTESVDTFMNESDDEIKILESLVMNGLVVDDPEVLRHMDTHPQDTPKVIPVSYKKDGTLSALSSAVAPEKFDVLSWHVRKKAEDLSNRIFAGQIPVHPYRYARRTACDYCNYRSVCGFDSSIRGFEWHQMKKMKKDEVWQKIGKEAGKWDLNGPESRKQS